jgi:hypothetical protein
MDIINESVLINRDNVLEFLAKILNNQELDKQQKKEFMEKFNRLVKNNTNE